MQVKTRTRILRMKERINSLYVEAFDLAQTEDRPELGLTLRKAGHQLVIVELELESIVND